MEMENRSDNEAEQNNTRCSTISDARGSVLEQAGADEEGVRIVEVDIAQARDKMVTPRNDLFGDRRPELYAALSKAGPAASREG
jgi:hypothetical protein